MPRKIQLEAMDDDLRNSLWNSILSRFDESAYEWQAAAELLAKYLFKIPTDTVPSAEHRARSWIRDRFFAVEWHQTYDVVEFLVNNVDNIKQSNTDSHSDNQLSEFIAEMNGILQREMAGYRFIRGALAPISEPVEVSAIDAAANICYGGGVSGASTHIRAALALLGRKPTADYRNSIKESISAVESAVNVVAGTSGDGVAKAIEILSSKAEIHPSLRTALKQLYGYTSNEDGIRHSILEQSAVGFAEAKFMLVACSAFVNFIADKGREAAGA